MHPDCWLQRKWTDEPFYRRYLHDYFSMFLELFAEKQVPVVTTMRPVGGGGGGERGGGQWAV